MVMAVFAYIYHQSFVVPQSFSVELILDQVNVIRYASCFSFAVDMVLKEETIFVVFFFFFVADIDES